MKVKNFYWYAVTEYGADKDIERYFKTRQDVADHLDITLAKVSYYSKRSALRPRRGTGFSIVKLTGDTKVPITRQQRVPQVYVRPK